MRPRCSFQFWSSTLSMMCFSSMRMFSAPICASLSANSFATASCTSLAMLLGVDFVCAIFDHAASGRRRIRSASSASRPGRSHCSSIEFGGTKRATMSATTSSRMPHDVLLHAVGFQQFVALLVDDLALVVVDVVEVEQVLADVEVVGLDLALRVGDLLGDQRAFDDVVFLQAHARHRLLHPVGGEDAHQVVFERQVEARGARVALAAGAAAQLVVDAARFVAFGADDVQAAGGLAPRRGAAAIRLRARGPCRPRRRPRPAPASSASSEPPSTMSVPRPAMLVAMVTAPGRPAWATMCASRSCCLALSTSCGMPASCSCSESSSETSIEVVPTSTGWPRSWQSRISSTTARYLPARLRNTQVGMVLAHHRPVGRDHDRLPGRRCSGTRRPRCRPCRSCPRASCTCGTGSGR